MTDWHRFLNVIHKFNEFCQPYCLCGRAITHTAHAGDIQYWPGPHAVPPNDMMYDHEGLVVILTVY